MNILFVGGTWNEEGGKPSGLLRKMYGTAIACGSKGDKIACKNGGTYNDIVSITKADSFAKNDIIFWFPNIQGEQEKIFNIKELAPSANLVVSRRNEGKYSVEELNAHRESLGASMLLELSQAGKKQFGFRLIDMQKNTTVYSTDINVIIKTAIIRLSGNKAHSKVHSAKKKYDGIEK